jgi:hypothetical protein
MDAVLTSNQNEQIYHNRMSPFQLQSEEKKVFTWYWQTVKNQSSIPETSLVPWETSLLWLQLHAHINIIHFEPNDTTQ